MADLASLLKDIAEGRERYAAELKQHTTARWTTKPTGSADGEAAWCARQVAEHIAGSSGFFGMGIGRAAGVKAMAMPQFSFAHPEQAVAATPGALDALVGVIKQVPAEALDREIEFGPLGKTTLANVIGIVAYHLNDHAAQLQSLR
ncbi:MAG: DinB family protein [Dehalococcoidia bacterium]